MNVSKINRQAEEMTELTLNMFQSCRKREERHAKRFGVSVAEFRCLRILNFSDHLQVNELAANMGLTSSRLTRILDGMVRKDLIERNINENDRRGITISLSLKGKKLAKTINETYISLHAHILAKITNKERPNTIAAMKKVLSSMEEVDSDHSY